MIDRQRIKKEFADYVNNYDVKDPKINLKIVHTYKVGELCEIIAKAENVSAEDIDTAWAIGMLHDIGRFEQCRIYDTFIDSESVDHAQFGCELLFGNTELIKKFVTDESIYGYIHDAIWYHNVFKIPDTLDEKTAFFANVIRDADKIDIIRANNETSLTDIYNTTEEELRSCGITKEVLDSFYNHTCVLRSLKKTPIDNVVGHVSLMYELVFNKSKELAKSLGYVDEMLQFKSNNPETNKQFALMRQEIDKYFADIKLS